ncbi:MAG: alpha/beta fold hydrolase, partial [Anaerolineae bacterium]|nr:alpha/beta fold hydrolase [Anaerolineae bacterium]
MATGRTRNKSQTNLTFQPHPLARNKHIQTIAPNLLPSQDKAICRSAQEMILELKEGTRLQGFYSPQPQKSKGIFLLLSGWLGSAHSNYVLNTGEHLYQNGYSVFRLNFCDHGRTEHLNRKPFRPDHLDEVYKAAHDIAQLESDHPFYIVGFSLGGNFGLRLVWKHSQTPLPNLEQVVVFS